jgi:hypothetical protein
MFKSKKRKELENRVANLESKVIYLESEVAVAATTATISLDSSKVAESLEKQSSPKRKWDNLV